jgi:hypothetical protein
MPIPNDAIQVIESEKPQEEPKPTVQPDQIEKMDEQIEAVLASAKSPPALPDEYHDPITMTARRMADIAWINQSVPASASSVQAQWMFARVMAKSDAEAAKMVGVPRATVCNWANKTELDAAVVKLMARPLAVALDILTSAAAEAATALVMQLRQSTAGRERTAAANSILDRVGFGRGADLTTHSQAVQGHNTLIIREIRRIKKKDGTILEGISERVESN